MVGPGQGHCHDVSMVFTVCESLKQSAKEHTSARRALDNTRGTLHTLKHWIDGLKSRVNLISDLGSREHNLATDKDQQHNLGLDHAVNQAREKLGLVGAKVMMARCQTLETNRKLDVARPDNVLDLKVRELGVEPELLDDTSVFARSKLAVVFTLRTRHDHFT